MCSPDGNDVGGLHGKALSIDTVLEVLQSGIRREIVGYCVDRSARVIDVDDLADHVVSERRRSGRAVEHEGVVAALHHKHLPILAEHGVIEYDPGRGQLRYSPDDRLEEWLARIRTRERE